MKRVTSLAALALAVAAPGPASAAAPADAAARKCDRKVVFRYDVTVTGAKSGRETYLPESRLTGEFLFSFSYSARYPAVRVVVNRGCDPEIDTVRALTRGTTTLVDYFQADRAVPKEGSSELPCEFQTTAADFVSRLRVTGGTAVRGGGPSAFSVRSELPYPQLDELILLLDGHRDAACDKGSPSNLPVMDDLLAYGPVPIFERAHRAGGVKLDPPSGALHAAALGGGRSGPRPLTRLVAGRSFRVSSGVRRHEGIRNGAEATAATSLTIRFERRR